MVRDLDASNRRSWDTESAVRGFAREAGLQEPEKAILRILGPKLSDMRVLDMGVGAGRTTPYLAPLAQEYRAFDSSVRMVRECRRRFPGIRFDVADAAALKDIPDRSFDFILFSYNGIDGLSHERRLKVFDEVLRVGRPGGWFAFSSHNLQSIKSLFALRLELPPGRFVRSLRRCLLTRLHNPSPVKLLRQDHAMINEAAHFLKLKHYYIKPRAQIRQLTEAGFDQVQLLGLDGRRIFSGDLDRCEDSWIYYLCTPFAGP